MLIQLLDQALLWSCREIRDFPLKWGCLLWRASGQDGVNSKAGEVGEAFLKVTWSVPGKGGGWGTGNEGALERVAVETESSVGQCGVRGVILGGDCSEMLLVVWGGWVGGWGGVTHTRRHTLHSNGWTHMQHQILAIFTTIQLSSVSPCTAVSSTYN